MSEKNAPARIIESVGTRTVSRRTVTRGIAWTTPVVAIATAAPAFAASCDITLVLDPLQSCKKANANSYRLVFQISAGACEVPPGCTATITKVTENTGQATVLYSGPPVQNGQPLVICNTNNLSSKVIVTATISCDGGVSKDYLVTVNQFTNNASTCTSDQFC